MKKEPLVSVIVPVYNVESYLACCLDSIVNQTYRNLDIILVNDGSTDNSEAICRAYEQDDPRIRVFTQDNRGLSAARNTGLDHMKGEYVTFVDSDDYISPCLVDILLQKLLEYEVSVAICDYRKVEDQEDHAGLDTIPPAEPSFCRKTTGWEVLDAMGTAGCIRYIIAIGKLYHRNIFEELRYPVGRVHEDEFVFHRIYTQTDSVCCVDLRLYAYRQSLNSITRKGGERRTRSNDVVEMYLDRLAFFHRLGITKYDLCIEKLLFSVMTLPLSGDTDKKRARQYREMVEERVLQITGKRFFSCLWVLFKISPGCYRAARTCCWRILKRIAPSKYEDVVL